MEREKKGRGGGVGMVRGVGMKRIGGVLGFSHFERHFFKERISTNRFGRSGV